nr:MULTISPECIES: DUF429 domain-containing protein [unclassified Dehalobacter]
MILFNRLTGKEKNYISVGIDGCKGGWLVVAISNETFEVGKFKTIEEICIRYQGADSLLIDIPIGLPESKVDVVKRPDNELRTLLSKKASSVFNTPFRQIVYAADEKIAWELNRELDAKQTPISMALCKAIKQVDVFLQNNPQWKNRLLESHPEYCFYLLNGGIPLEDNKRDDYGQEKRIDILKDCFSESQAVIETYKKQNKLRKKIDDVLDALCLAIVGRLGCNDGYRTIPDLPYQDCTGLNMQITVFKRK